MTERPGTGERTAVIIGLYLSFIVGYRLTNLLADGTATLATSLDLAIPLIPAFIVPYVIGYAFPVLPAFLLRTKKELRMATLASFGIMAVSFLIFILFPVVYPRPAIEGMGIFQRMLAVQFTVDRPYNNFPSLHVSLASFSYFVLLRARRKLGLWLLPPYLIILASPMLVKQHYVADVVGGLALAGAGFLLYRRLTKPMPA